MVVAEALRIKLIPPTFLKAEFDNTLKPVARSFFRMRNAIYRREVARVAKMTEQERINLSHSLMRAMGHEPAEGGVIVRRASCGPNVAGFAIDPMTMQTLITHEFGMHRAVAEMLSYRILNIEALCKRKARMDLTEDEERECRWRIITGLIFSEIDGFETPFIQLFGTSLDPKYLRKVVRFFKKEQKFIPVGHDGKLMEG